MLLGIISGYLVSASSYKQSTKKFLADRAKKTLKPFMVAILLTMSLVYIGAAYMGRVEDLLPFIYDFTFKHAFWFVPMQLVSVLILRSSRGRVGQIGVFYQFNHK